MQIMNGDDPPRGAGERRWCPFEGVWQVLRHGFKLFQVCWRENLLLRPFRRRSDPPADVTFAQLIEQLKSMRPTRLLPEVPHSEPGHGQCAPVGLVLWATAAVMVSIGSWVMLGVSASTPGRLIATSGEEIRSEQLPDGSVVVVAERSSVRVNVTPQERVAHVEHGTVMFDVKSGPPFAVHTFLARALVRTTAKFRVVVHDSSVEFSVEEGAVLLYDRNAKPEAPALKLEKGQSRTYDMPVARVASMIELDGGMCVRMGG